MANWTLTADMVDPNHKAPGGIINAEAFQALVDRGFEDIAKEKFAVEKEMESVVYFEKVKHVNGKGTTFPQMGGGTPMNRDEDDPQYASAAPGFPYEYDTQPFRKFVQFPRDAFEQDIDIGFTKDRVNELIDGHAETVEARLADIFNRGDGDGGAGAPVLAPDGGYLLDDNRPNPDADAGTWGNLEATADLSGDTIFQASLNARLGVSPIGRLFTQTIKTIMIPAEYEQLAFTLFSTNQLVGTNFNDASWAAAKFNMEQVKVMSRLTSPLIYYWLSDPKSSDNGVRLYKFKDIESKTWWDQGRNPDLMYGRIRSRWGVGLRDVRKTCRGGRLSPIS